ncbi:CHRD domain superfamily protein [Thecamonas trahens ATCC 50062]|uniref:CHRD domain superfamily protein n=1 Tax=Thecamonas trahens ATCC 50062 TaxID=461836 RepID=A0A0L0DAM8_THETB|nr:CHRD domain superfamily protein [Thecamonas trahens ATCC 50062]KNC48353.1 CHRD domain superfamily protein [Thecamonas trahens ATCC 50062]|eukprot:XP_013758477.1 CHRD domain superfamily protein [Thecamonas trahens ATCC 50062]
MNTAGIFSVLVVTCLLACAGIATGTAVRALPATGVAVLNGYNEIPVAATTARGVAVLSWDPVTARITYSVVTNVTSDITGIHLHSGSEKLFFSTTGWGTSTPVDRKWGALISAGNTYVNVHTVDFPSGEVRGDVWAAGYSAGPNMLIGAVVAEDVFETVRDPAAGPMARAVGFWQVNTVTGLLSMEVAVAHPDITAIHIHQNTLGREGTKVCDFLASRTGNCDSLNADLLANGGYYFNFHTSSSAYMRGQTFALDATAAPSQFNFAGHLDAVASSNVVGVALGAFDASSSSLTVQVWHNASAALGVSVGNYVLCTGAGACDSPVVHTFDGPLNVTETAKFFAAPGLTVNVADGTGIVAGGVLSYQQLSEGTTYLPRAAGLLSGFEATYTEPVVARGAALMTSLDATGSSFRYTVVYATDSVGAGATVHLGVNATAGYVPDAVTFLGSGANSGAVTGTFTAASVGLDFNRVVGVTSFIVRTDEMPTGSGAVRGQMTEVAIAPASQITHVARLDKQQEVPPSTSAATGVAVATFNPVDFTVDYRVVWVNLASAVSQVHLHQGAAGTNGPKMFVVADSPAGNGIEGSTPPLTATQAADFVAGNAYWNVHTVNHPAGAIRGQITAPKFTYAAAPSVWDVSRTYGASPQTSAATSVLITTYEEEMPGGASLGTYSLMTTYTGGAVTAADIAAPHKAGETGSALQSLCVGPCGQSESAGTSMVDRQIAVAARTGLAYVEVMSVTEGTVRAQIEALAPVAAPVVPAGSISWMVRLSGWEEATPVDSPWTGFAALTWNEASSTLDYAIWHTVPDATKVHLHQASGGAALYEFAATPAASVSPVVGSLVIAPEHRCMLKSQTMYVNLHSVTNPGGELRGTVAVSEFNYGSVSAVGGQEVPPVLSTRGGMIAVSVDANAMTMNATVLHNIKRDVTKVHMHLGAAGTNGALTFDIGTLAWLSSPISLPSLQSISAAQLASFNAGEFYLNLHSWLIPSGEARGQIVPVVPPAACVVPPSPSPPPPPPPTVAAAPPPPAPGTPSPPPPGGSSAISSPSKDDGVFKTDNYILAGVALGSLIIGILISAIICKCCCSGSGSSKRDYDMGGASALMTI